MNQAVNTISSCTPIANIKVYTCQHCNATYTDKIQFQMHKSAHLKDSINFSAAKEQQLPSVVHIVMAPEAQMHPSPTPAHQTATQMPVILHDQQELASYKKSFGVEAQQIYTLAPISQYQVIAGNTRAINVLGTHDNQSSLNSFSAPTYVVTATPDGHQLQPVTEIIQQDPLGTSDLHGQILQIGNQAPVEIQINNTQTIVSGSRQSRLVSVRDRPFKCDQCTASFIESQELVDHKKKHTGDGPFTCEDCHFTFMYKSHFKSHKTRCLKKRASLTKPAILSPALVRRQFPTNSIKLENMAPVISVAKVVSMPALCIKNQPRQVSSKQQAPSMFNPNQPSFKRVKKEGRLDRPHECAECDASFQTEADLKIHSTKHTGEGPFKCDECKFVFLYRKLYEAHKRRCDRKKKDSMHHDPHPQQYILPSIYPSIADTHCQVADGATMDVSSMQIMQPAIIEMHPATSDGQQISHQNIIERVIVPTGNQSGGRQQFKYEIIQSGDGVNVNQIVNLIKVKDPQS